MHKKSLVTLIADLKAKKYTPQEVWEYFLDRQKKYDPQLQSFVRLNPNGLQHDTSLPLAGVPIGVKDNFCEKWVITSCSSKMLENFAPPYDATVIERLKEAWFSSMGKLNMDEFAMGSTSETSYFWKTRNPWGTDRIPGGSSGGSAAAVAAWLCPAALGSDTGGSIRQPASMCNVVGFKPSYGRNSRSGLVPMASSLDCPGTLTKTVQDAGLLYEIMNGHDPREATSLEWKDILSKDIWERKDLKGIKIGLPKQYFESGIDTWVHQTLQKAIQTLGDLGAQIVEISLPMTSYAIATYYILMPAEVSTNLGRFDGLRFGFSSDTPYENMDELYRNNRGQWFGEEVQRRSILGSYVLSAGYYDAYYKKAAQVRTLIIEDFRKAFEKVDVIVSPVSPSVAWKMGEKMDDPVKMYLSDAYTIPASLAGLPGISVPAGFAHSEDQEKEMLPVGMQILGAHGADQKVLEVAYVFQEATRFGEKTPEGFSE